MASPVYALLAGLAVLLMAVVCLWPRWGIAARWRRGGAASDRVRVDDALKPLWHVEYLPHGMRLVADSGEVVLAPVVAPSITVEETRDVADRVSLTQLSALAPGEAAHVVAVSPTCRGAQRRRLLDLGIVPGTRIVHELAAPGGDPMAFRIRGALIALRRDHAALIHVDRATEVQA